MIAGYVSARGDTGAPINDLLAEELVALEDGQPQPLAQLRAVQPGLRVILVLNPADPFSIRDGEAIIRFDYVKTQILDWADGLPADNGTLLSLITPDGIKVQDSSPTAWISAFEEIPTNFSGQQLTAQPFLQALELAAQIGETPGQGAAIWWVTATPPPDVLVNMPDWQAVLLERGTPLFVWQVDASSTFESQAGQTLRTFAEGSGGQRFTFSGGEIFPNPEDLFSPFRNAYFFQYSSKLHSPGGHQVELQLIRADLNVTSRALSFELDIRPPNPILISPPSQINRGPAPDDPQQLAPFSQAIEILIEFPDQFQRGVVRTSLYMDGVLVAENRAAPFTLFSWDLINFNTSQQVNLRVEAEDELGLVGSSIEIPVQILVENPLTWYQALLARGGPLLALGGVIFAAAIFFLVMVLSGQLKPAGRRAGRRRRAAAQENLPRDPLVDSPLSMQEGLPALVADAVDSEGRAARLAPAYLQRLNMQDATQSAEVIPLFGEEFLIGSQRGCEIRLQEESVTAEHARLTRQEEGSYHVADLGSDAGTWVNYAPISAEGSLLRDGDLLHIGRVAFRFLLNTNQ